MSTLEKTINLLHALPESQVEVIYSFVQFLSSQQKIEKPVVEESLDDIFQNLVGVLPDTGKTLEEYREERIRERYETLYTILKVFPLLSKCIHDIFFRHG